MPDVPFSRSVIEIMSRGAAPDFAAIGYRPSEKFPRAFRLTTCDAQGNFTFDRVADGTWTVFTVVKWTVGEYNNEGGILVGYPSVSSGSSVRIILTSKDAVLVE